ncbi:VanZ family protein [Singulisphaera rosea]
MRKVVVTLLLVAYGILLFYLTLYAGTTHVPWSGRVRLIPLETITTVLTKDAMEILINIVGNLAVFMPIGLLVPSLRDEPTSARRIAALSAGVSLLIEVLQLFSGRRIADVDDVLLNTIGGLLGFAAYLAACRLLTRLRLRPVRA